MSSNDEKIITSIKFERIKGFRGYKQGVKKGRGNYSHYEKTDSGSLYYNGYGGVRGFQESQLLLKGKSNDGTLVEYDVRKYILELVNRKSLTDSLLEKIENDFPQTIIITDIGDGKIQFDSKTIEYLKNVCK